MLSTQVISAAVSLQRSMYMSLTEVDELTTELSEAVNRQDQVSVQIFLSMRQEPINRLQALKARVEKQCAQLPPSEGALLRDILNGQGTPSNPQEEELTRLVEKNRGLLSRIVRADRRISQRLGGTHSFYSDH